MWENKVDKVINNTITGIENYKKLKAGGGGWGDKTPTYHHQKKILVQDIFFVTQIALL